MIRQQRDECQLRQTSLQGLVAKGGHSFLRKAMIRKDLCFQPQTWLPAVAYGCNLRNEVGINVQTIYRYIHAIWHADVTATVRIRCQALPCKV